MNVKFFVKYCLYILLAKHRHGHGIHSPFLYEFLTNVIEADHKEYYIFQNIENLRLQLLQSNEEILIDDHGSGSQINSKNRRKIKDIVKYSAKSSKYGRLLFRLVNHFAPKNILELGTSMGFSTMYLAAPHSKAEVVTIEACKNQVQYAQHHFSLLELHNIQILHNNFDAALPEFLKNRETIDFVFFDGNHRKKHTLEYFSLCLKKVHNQSVFVFDDIHWSNEMEEAWTEIKNHPEVRVTIDLFFLGLVFFRQELSKQNFIIKF